MRSILILTAGFGNGHNAAAFNLRDAFGVIAPGELSLSVHDLIYEAYGWRSEVVKTCFLALVNRAPWLWANAYRFLDRAPTGAHWLRRLRPLQQRLAQLIHDCRPDAIVSTYPAYNVVIDALRENGGGTGFLKINVVTDSISVNSLWHATPSDLQIVANEWTAQVLHAAGVPADCIATEGFPVSPVFARLAQAELTTPAVPTGRKRILYIVQHGRGIASGLIAQLLDQPDFDLTIACGNHPSLERRLQRRIAHAAERARVIGWSDRMPELLVNSHLLIAKAGGALVQEAIAARCPMIVDQIIPGQEEGNAKLLTMLGIGAVAANDDHVVALARHAFANDNAQWFSWKSAMVRHSRPDAAIRIADAILRKIDGAEPRNSYRQHPPQSTLFQAALAASRTNNRPLFEIRHCNPPILNEWNSCSRLRHGGATRG